MFDVHALQTHLTESELSGRVSTTIQNTRGKIAGLFEGDPRCRFGLSLCDTATRGTIQDALMREAGASLDGDPHIGYIDPVRTLAGVAAYGSALGEMIARRPARVLIATGHPAGLLGHYATLAAELEACGIELVRPLDGGADIAVSFPEEPASSIRFVQGVACVYRRPGALAHSHLPDYMNAMLDAQDSIGAPVEFVIGDHGMAGAAIERGIPTLSIADVNDIPLLLAAGIDGHTTLVIDDNRPARTFLPVTDAILTVAGRIRD